MNDSISITFQCDTPDDVLALLAFREAHGYYVDDYPTDRELSSITESRLDMLCAVAMQVTARHLDDLSPQSLRNVEEVCLKLLDLIQGTPGLRIRTSGCNSDCDCRGYK
jgi:hypothetical protein